MNSYRIGFFFCISIFIFVASSCFSSRNGQKSSTRDLNRLVTAMTGDFSSAAQQKRDSDYYDIHLHIQPIWKGDKSAHWLYVEQATASAESKPYRQRVYKVEKDGTEGFKSTVYMIPDPSNWVGKYKTPNAFDKIKPADLSLRDGCTVFLKKQQDMSFSGSTQGQGCESTLRGAKYATSKVIITSKILRSWDQGFNEKGEQMWGAKKGAYEFIKY